MWSRTLSPGQKQQEPLTSRTERGRRRRREELAPAAELLSTAGRVPAESRALTQPQRQPDGKAVGARAAGSQDYLPPQCWKRAELPPGRKN